MAIDVLTPLPVADIKLMNRTHLRILILLLFAVLSMASDHKADALPNDPQSIYSQKRPSRDGVGKVYMGREISFVMGHRGIDWLERPERRREERTDLVIKGMQLEPDAVVVDLGAGSGYFSFRIGPRVPQGRVLAVDIQPEMLQVIEQRKLQDGTSNIETILGSETSPNLPAAAVDAVLMVDAYHEFSHPREMMLALVEALRPGGRVFLVEYRGEDPSIPILPLHKMTEAQARLEMEAVGLEFVENRAMLPQQHFLVFRKPDPTSAGMPSAQPGN